MSQEITDAMLDEQARKATVVYACRHGISRASVGCSGFYSAHRAALEVEREAYLALKEALSIALRDYPDEAGDESLYVTQLRTILDRLRTRLGITE